MDSPLDALSWFPQTLERNTSLLQRKNHLRGCAERPFEDERCLQPEREKGKKIMERRRL